MKKPYIDYEDDETCLPLQGARYYRRSKLNADYTHRWKMRNTNTATT